MPLRLDFPQIQFMTLCLNFLTMMTSSYVIFIFRFYNVLLETAGSILKSASHIWVMVISWYLVHFLIEITVFFKPVSEIYAKFTYETRFCF